MTLKSVSTSLLLIAALLADTTCAFALPTAKRDGNVNNKLNKMIEIDVYLGAFLPSEQLG